MPVWVANSAGAASTRGFDKWNIPPGVLFQPKIEEALLESDSIAVLFGKSGVGPWEQMELRVGITESIKRNVPAIPVVLPNTKDVPELPPFLKEFNWVRFRRSFSEADPFANLLWGINGKETREDPAMHYSKFSQKKRPLNCNQARLLRDRRG